MALTSLTCSEHTNALCGQVVALLAVQSLVAGNACFPEWPWIAIAFAGVPVALASFTPSEHTNALGGQAVALFAVQSLATGNVFFSQNDLGSL